MRCAGAASAIRPCCAPWTKCRANISSPPDLIESAYADQALPIACGQTISQPFVVAYMTEQLEVEPQHRVLEIGTGSGYQAAVLSRLAREVVSIERYRTLADAARSGSRRWATPTSPSAPATAWRARRIWRRSTASWSPPPPRKSPKRLTAQLAEGGKMVVPVGPRHDTQHIVKLTKQPDGALTRENLIAVRFVPLLPGQAREL